MELDKCDDWIVESFTLYKDLHDFELQDPTRVLEWTGDKTICVAGYDSTRSNEILQLLLPQKLHASVNRGSSVERDLRVHRGGFSAHPVYGLKHVPQTSLVVTSGPNRSHLQVWDIGTDDKDVIKLRHSIPSEEEEETWTKITTTSSPSPRVIHGAKADSIQVTDVESIKHIHTPDVTHGDPVSSLCSLDSNTFFVCCTSGRLYVADVRQPEPAGEGTLDVASPSNPLWSAAVRCRDEDAASTIASLSSEGHMVITDTRNLSSPLKSARFKVPTPAPSELFLCVTWAPVLEDTIAISGLDSTVQIYNTSSWDTTMKECEPLFNHKGHSVMGFFEEGNVPVVTTHLWHPLKERTLLSAATDCSLHAWDWVEKQTEQDSV